MPKCSYCNTQYELHKGSTLVLKDGTAKHLCSSKCRKNMLMKRRKVRWIIKTKKDKTEVPKEKVKEKEEKKEEVKVKVEEKKE